LLTNKELATYAEKGLWSEIKKFYEKSCINFDVVNSYFYVATALIHTSDFPQAATLVNKGLFKSPSNSWARHLKHQIDTKLQGSKTAQDELYKFLLENGTHETLAATFINTAIQLGDFLRAKEINEARCVIHDQNVSAPFAIALQTFCKADTLRNVLDSLLLCNETDKFHLFIIQDFPSDKHSDKYTIGHREVNELISSYIDKLRGKFELVSFVSNYENLGTAPTCRKLLDKVCNDYKGFVFLEDDCILSKDALKLAHYLLKSEIGLESKYWFGSLESTFYNLAEVDREHVEREIENAEKNNLQQGLYEIDFVPSTCFISTVEIWELVKAFRSFPKGPESLTHYIKSIGKKTLLPIVPRARDKGMTHELGYSVHKLGQEGVKEHKHHFLDADDFSVSTEYWKVPNTHELLKND
jgi:hypothetical protein